MEKLSLRWVPRECELENDGTSFQILFVLILKPLFSLLIYTTHLTEWTLFVPLVSTATHAPSGHVIRGLDYT